MTRALSPRRADAADAPAIRNLTRSAYEKWVAVIGREPLPMSADQTAAVLHHLVYLCEKAGELLAAIELIPAEDHLLIENLAVRPDMQGQGLGEGLLAFAESCARSHGVKEIRLYTNAAFTANLSFYSRRGYREYRRDALASGGSMVHMRKPLDAGTI